MKIIKCWLIIFISGNLYIASAQIIIKKQIQKGPSSLRPATDVNVFLGSSGDHGQMSPAASYPFSMLSIGPQTYPNLHMGYEHKAKLFMGFTHNRFEGVGCQGSGGNILIKPIYGTDFSQCQLIKGSECAGPGFYRVNFTNGISTAIAVFKNSGIESYKFAKGKTNGFYIDLSHTLANHFVTEEHEIKPFAISGWIASRTTCNVGTYRIYYCLKFDRPVKITVLGTHKLYAALPAATSAARISVGISSVDAAHAEKAIHNNSLQRQQALAQDGWNQVLNTVKVTGDPARTKLFYSLLYRTVQSPYVISEPDGVYRAIDGSLQKSNTPVYHGWSIWDNYRTQLPLLSAVFPGKYQAIINSIANLYPHGKQPYATQQEPSNSVRTEHAIVVLLDAFRKGYVVDFKSIRDSLISEESKLDFKSPDKALESSYDSWALADIMKVIGDTVLSSRYRQKALGYETYWNKDFKDITKKDVDKVGARGLYQGTIWQYRWFVPFDVKGLIGLAGGDQAFRRQLDQFFDNDLYNAANEPDIQAPLMYNMTAQPWKSQALMHKYAADPVIQYYFNDNSRGIDPYIGQVYQNKPDAYLRTMDDDAGAMSAWYIFAACGFSPACAGWPVYYLHLPLFKKVIFNRPGGKPFTITVKNFNEGKRYIRSVKLNGKTLERNWLTHQEIMQGGNLEMIADDLPNKAWGLNNQWISSLTSN